MVNPSLICKKKIDFSFNLIIDIAANNRKL